MSIFPDSIKKVAILGPGLLGGSLALAIRDAFPACHMSLWARDSQSAEQAAAFGISDAVSIDLKQIVQTADLIVFCVPIGAMPGLATQILPYLKPDALITDVGSVKSPVVRSLENIFDTHGQFVGSHPMAGSEQSGLAAARKDLFKGAVCILTPTEKTHQAALSAISRFWTAIGCSIQLLTPEEHDQNIGLVSHLPHLLAAALIDFVCAENPNSVNFCGNGFRDTTRIAAGSPEMWTEIFAFNRQAVHTQLEGFIETLQSVSRDLAGGNDLKIKEFLSSAKIQRDLLNGKNLKNE